jgi:uridine phosphorylase
MLQPHIQLDETAGARYAILPGDPARLDRIAPHLENVRELAYNREFRSLTGIYKGLPVIAISTGIGGSSASIAVEELHNIGVTAMIRIGSCGAIQPDIALGDLIFACGAVRDDGASRAYVDVRYPAIPDTGLLCHCRDTARENGWGFHLGVVHSHESFYIDTNDAEEAEWSKRGVLGSDMETAALFTVGRLRGVRTASILNNVVLYGQDTADSIGDYADGASMTAEGEKREILTALEALYRLSLEDAAESSTTIERNHCL